MWKSFTVLLLAILNVALLTAQDTAQVALYPGTRITNA